LLEVEVEVADWVPGVNRWKVKRRTQSTKEFRREIRVYLTIRMKENVTVQISIMVKQNNRTKTSDAIIWYKKWCLKLRFLVTIW